MADTGAGATLSLSATGSVGNIRSMTGPEFTIDKLETSDLSTTIYKTYVPTDLSDPGELTAEILFDARNSMPSVGTVETVTVTWPIHTSTNTTNATLVGTGFVTAWKVPDFQIGELQVATITVAFDGLTDPAYTVESA